MFDSQRPRGGV